MGFIERILFQKAEAARQATQETAKREQERIESKKQYDADVKHLRPLTQKYYSESIYPKLVKDFKKIEPESRVIVS